MNPIQPLKPNFKLDENYSAIDQIRELVRSEDNYDHCKGYPAIKSTDIKGRAGAPIKGKVFNVLKAWTTN